MTDIETLMTDVEILRATKERLFEKGWRKGKLGPKEGPNCLVGSIYHATHVPINHVIYQLLAENTNLDVHFHLGEGKGVWEVESFNDQESTTFDDIMDLIDRTIKTLEQEN